MKFPTATQLRKSKKILNKKNVQIPLAKTAKRFVQEKVLPAVLEGNNGYSNNINVALPWEAYSDIDGFVAECKKIIPKDYTVERSHDGAGMYDTLCVSW
jgi:hypothetical protein